MRPTMAQRQWQLEGAKRRQPADALPALPRQPAPEAVLPRRQNDDGTADDGTAEQTSASLANAQAAANDMGRSGPRSEDAFDFDVDHRGQD